MAPMKQINATDRILQTIQDNTVSAIQGIESATHIDLTTGSPSTTSIQSPFSGGGHLVSGVVLTSGADNLIPHKLGRVPQVWILCNISASATVWSPTSTQLGGLSANTQYLNLWTSSSATVSLWVA